MYLGTLGRMVGIKCPTAQRVAHADRYSFETTLGGQVKAQVRAAGRRTWDVSLGRLSTPADVGALMDFVQGAWGPGPFWFVSADAPGVNMLTPAAAQCDPASLVLHGGRLLGSPPLNLGDDGITARSVWTNGGGAVVFGEPVPVMPGRPVTGAAWILGPGNVRLSFLNSAGETIRSNTSPPSTVPHPQRVAVTAIPPDAAVSVRLMTTEGVTQSARPTITWTDQAYEWGDGQGCSKAIVHGAQRDVTKAWDNPHTGRWSDLSFVIQEVG